MFPLLLPQQNLFAFQLLEVIILNHVYHCHFTSPNVIESISHFFQELIEVNFAAYRNSSFDSVLNLDNEGRDLRGEVQAHIESA